MVALIKAFDGTVIILGEVIEELDKLKSSEGAKGYKARRALRGIKENLDDIVLLMSPTHYKKDEYVDDLIIEFLKLESSKNHTLVTNDLGLSLRANAAGIQTAEYHEKGVGKGNINPFTMVEFSKNEYSDFMQDPANEFGVKNGQYLFIRDKESKNTITILKYLGNNNWEEIEYSSTLENSYYELKPRDDEQRAVIDSLVNDDFTLITGPAGTGKTIISLAYILQRIDEGSKVHIFINPSKTRDTEELGFYPGDRIEKLLQNNIGDILSNKIGARSEIYRLIESGALNLYPFSDIRGVEVPKGDIMYITEAQNLSVDNMKLAIQRCANGSKLIIEGDPFTQVDNRAFENSNNGMLRTIEVFFGTKNFGYVKLSKIYRSMMATVAEEL